MKLKQLLILIAVLAVAIVAVLMNKGIEGDAQDEAVGKKIFEQVKPEEVAVIVLNAGKEEVTLEIKDGKWVVAAREGFPANSDNISKLVTKAVIMEASDVKTDVTEKYLSRFKLQKPGTGGKEDETGTSVTFKKGDGAVLASFLIGKNVGNAAGMGGMSNSQPQYVKDDTVKDKVYVIKEAFDYFMNTITNKDWLDKMNFVKVEKPKSVTLTSAKPEEGWVVFREKEGTDVNELKLKDAKPDEDFDPNKAGNGANIFSSPSFTDVATGEAKAKAGLETPARTAVVETFEGFKYTIKVGNPVEKAAGADPNAGASDEYYASYEVEASFPEKMPEPAAIPDDKRTEDEKKKAREEAEKKFTDDITKGKEKLAKEKALAGKIYIMPKSVVDPLLKNRAELMKDKPPEGAAPTPGATPDGHATPPVAPPAAPTAAPKREPVTATTPPISVDIKPSADAKPAVEVKPAEPTPKVEIKTPEAKPEGEKK
jgi:hypothetical protein